MKARDLQAYFRSLNGGWMDLDETVDTFKSGDPEAEIRGVAVSWMSTTAALKEALAMDCNVFVTHEPTYYNHHDDPAHPVFQLEATQQKRDFIEESGIVILRCYDLWDQVPETGIADAWGAALGLGDAVAGEGYYRVYDVSGRTAGDVARQVATRTARFGQEAVQLIGRADTPVSRVAIGTGAITPLFLYIQDYDIDLAICTDDGFTYWQHGAYARDTGLPVIVVNHATSEEPGMHSLADHLRRRFPDVPVHFIPHGCMYTLVVSAMATSNQ
ncbi:MAG: Nif3-like dinuclear metal center hexameric protein [Anaerolineae bacterium]